MDKPSYLITKEEIANTPFTIVSRMNEKTSEIEHALFIGKLMLTKPSTNKEEHEEEAKKINWNKIAALVEIIVDYKMSTNK